MRKIVTMVIGLVAFALTGCVQMQMDTVIEKDGSGIFEMTYAMSEDIAEALKEMQNMPGNRDEAPTLDDFDKETLEKSCKEHGVKLKKYSRTQEDGKDRLAVTMEFKDLESVSWVLAQSRNDKGGLKIYKTSEGNYILKSFEGEDTDEDLASAEDSGPDVDSMEDFDPEAMGKSMEIMGKLMSSISELAIGMRITVPGEIISHNAQRVEGRTLIWEIDSSNMMTAATDMEPEIVFSGKGVKIDAHTVD